MKNTKSEKTSSIVPKTKFLAIFGDNTRTVLHSSSVSKVVDTPEYKKAVAVLKFLSPYSFSLVKNSTGKSLEEFFAV